MPFEFEQLADQTSQHTYLQSTRLAQWPKWTLGVDLVQVL